MPTNLTLSNRIREVLLTGKWIANTNFKDQLNSITWEQAIRKVGDLNTIALLTFHVNCYQMGMLNVLNGGPLDSKDKYSFDAPEIKSEADWMALFNDFLKNAEMFAEKVEQLPDGLFDEPFVDEKYGTYGRNLDGFIEHAYYHLGQISLLRKMMAK